MSEHQGARSINLLDSGYDSGASKEQVMCAAIQKGYLGDDRVVAAFVDYERIVRTVQSPRQAFPDHFQPTIAAKANTI